MSVSKPDKQARTRPPAPPLQYVRACWSTALRGPGAAAPVPIRTSDAHALSTRSRRAIEPACPAPSGPRPPPRSSPEVIRVHHRKAGEINGRVRRRATIDNAGRRVLGVLRTEKHAHARGFPRSCCSSWHSGTTNFFGPLERITKQDSRNAFSVNCHKGYRNVTQKVDRKLAFWYPFSGLERFLIKAA